LLILPEEKDLSFLLSPDTKNNEEHRINYVAISRAKNKLFISVPSLDATNRAMLEPNFEIETL
jgi:DNA helicase II / ATP-dependent DNA helicase PcrA